MSLTTDVALMLLQLIALTIPPIVVLIQLVNQSDNLEWEHRKLSFALVFGSTTSLIVAALALLTYFVTTLSLPFVLYAALALVFLGLAPLTVFVGILYIEHRKAHGP